MRYPGNRKVTSSDFLLSAQQSAFQYLLPRERGLALPGKRFLLCRNFFLTNKGSLQAHNIFEFLIFGSQYMKKYQLIKIHSYYYTYRSLLFIHVKPQDIFVLLFLLVKCHVTPVMYRKRLLPQASACLRNSSSAIVYYETHPSANKISSSKEGNNVVKKPVLAIIAYGVPIFV